MFNSLEGADEDLLPGDRQLLTFLHLQRAACPVPFANTRVAGRPAYSLCCEGSERQVKPGIEVKQKQEAFSDYERNCSRDQRCRYAVHMKPHAHGLLHRVRQGGCDRTFVRALQNC